MPAARLLGNGNLTFFLRVDLVILHLLLPPREGMKVVELSMKGRDPPPQAPGTVSLLAAFQTSLVAPLTLVAVSL